MDPVEIYLIDPQSGDVTQEILPEGFKNFASLNGMLYMFIETQMEEGGPLVKWYQTVPLERVDHIVDREPTKRFNPSQMRDLWR